MLWAVPFLAAAALPAPGELDARFRDASSSVQNAAHTIGKVAKGAADTASGLKRAADDSGLTQAVVDKGKGAIRAGVDGIFGPGREAPLPEATPSPDAPLPSAPPAAQPADPPKKPKRHHHKADPIDPMVFVYALLGLLVALLVGGVYCATRRAVWAVQRSKRDAATLSVLQPIYAADLPPPVAGTELPCAEDLQQPPPSRTF